LKQFVRRLYHRTVTRNSVIAAAAVLAAATVATASASAASDDSGTVVVYSGRTEDLIQPILDRFAEETGIDVEVRYGNTSDLALLIEEEGEQSPADVFLSQSPGAVGYLDQRGLLGTLPDDVLALVPAEFHASDGSWVGFSGRQRVLAFNPEIVPEEELPSSVLDLTGEEWSGRIGIAPSNASFQDFVSAMRIELGDEATAEWLEGIAANDPLTFANNSAIVAAIGRGEIDVGLVNHYYVYQALAEDPDFPGRNHNFAPDDIGSLVIVTAATKLAGAEHPDEAEQLVEFLLGEEAQRYFSDGTFEYPLADGVEPADVLPDVDLTAASDIHLDLDDLGGDLESTREMIRDAGLEG
jgi:iron(III) transport system substrate-binding protein